MNANTFRTIVPAASVIVTPDHQLVGVSFAQGRRAAIAERVVPGCTLGFIKLDGPVPPTARRLDLHPAPAVIKADGPRRGIVRLIEE